ncbi:MAG: 5'-3' exonuclease H3TH domain-containing protein [Myxococcota bacterium]
MSTEHLLILDGTVLVLRPYFVGVSAPWAPARRNVQKAMATTSHLAIVIDRTMDTFRRQLDPNYKAHRPPAPPDLIAHFDRFEAEMGELGVTVFGSLTYEADDLAATLVRLATLRGMAVTIQADDKDLFQLVRDTPPVVVEDTRRGIRYDPVAVEAKLGVRPDQIVDYLSLVGDAVDGIPGVKGVGAKTAAALLRAMGTLDAILADVESVATLPIRGAKSLVRKISEGKDAALHARRLIHLVNDVDMGADPIGKCQLPG